MRELQVADLRPDGVWSRVPVVVATLNGGEFDGDTDGLESFPQSARLTLGHRLIEECRARSGTAVRRGAHARSE